MKVALVYDRVNKWGGAERVLLALHKLFPDAPLYTSVYNKENASWADVFDVRTSFLQKFSFARSNHELLAPFMPLAFESFDFDGYDLVISVTSEAAKGIITKPGTLHICYCLTPTRYLWSGYDEYFKNESMKFLSKPIVSALRRWDIVASQRPDVFIAISKEVQRRIKKYYGRESELVYPPISISNKQKAISKKKGDYFLVVSRLSKFTRYKRVDLAIEAANELDVSLKIVGEGSLRKELKEKAKSNVEFVGAVSDAELINYYKNSKALIFPGNEDLGLTMIEAQSLGKPVVAYKKGGAEEILDDKTGLFFDHQTKKALVEALRKFERVRFDPKAAVKNSEKFSFEKFKENFLSVVNNWI
jgi:glycosyltransferase involved in cell wall biosynthesis